MFGMKQFYIAFAVVAAVCTFLPQQSEADCWETETCQLNTWEVKGCQQYGRKEASRRPCKGGYHYTCCTENEAANLPLKPATKGADCWETDVCHQNFWQVKGCPQYGAKEVSRRPCKGGFFYTCCRDKAAGETKAIGGNGPAKVTKQGDMTYYYPSKGACGWTHNQNDMIVAVSGKLFTSPTPNLDPICGKKIKITDPTSGKSVICTIVDICPECAIGDVDVTPAAFQKLKPMVVGKSKVKWDYV